MLPYTQNWFQLLAASELVLPANLKHVWISYTAPSHKKESRSPSRKIIKIYCLLSININAMPQSNVFKQSSISQKHKLIGISALSWSFASNFHHVSNCGLPQYPTHQEPVKKSSRNSSYCDRSSSSSSSNGPTNYRRVLVCKTNNTKPAQIINYMTISNTTGCNISRKLKAIST